MKSINTLEFHNFLQDNVIDSVFLKDAFDSEGECDKLDPLDEQEKREIQQFKPDILQNIINLKNLFAEEFEIISHFVELSK